MSHQTYLNRGAPKGPQKQACLSQHKETNSFKIVKNYDFTNVLQEQIEYRTP
jgi:hypothetical protein